VNGGQTSTAFSALQAVFQANGHMHTAYEPRQKSTAVVEGQTISIGGTAVSIDGATISLAPPNDLVVTGDGRTSTVQFIVGVLTVTPATTSPFPTLQAVFQANGHKHTAYEPREKSTAYVDGQTSSIGGTAITIEGKIVSLAPPNAVVVNSGGQTRTIKFTAARRGTSIQASMTTSGTGSSASASTTMYVTGGSTMTTVVGGTTSIVSSGTRLYTTIQGGLTTDYIAGGTTIVTAVMAPSTSTPTGTVDPVYARILDTEIGRCPDYNVLLLSPLNADMSWLITCGVLYVGETMSQHLRKRTSGADCENECLALPRCIAFSYTKDQCSFYDSVNSTQPSNDPSYSALRLNNVSADDPADSFSSTVSGMSSSLGGTSGAQSQSLSSSAGVYSE